VPALYSNGFVNLDSGTTCGFFFDDSDYFVVIDVRKFSDFPLFNDEHFKEPREFNSKSDIVVRHLSDRLKTDIKRRVWDKELKKYDRDIEELTDEERKYIADEIKRVVSRHYKLTEQGEK
jgi:hypothetical protein